MIKTNYQKLIQSTLLGALAISMAALNINSASAGLVVSGFSSLTADSDARLRESEIDGTWHARTATNWSIAGGVLTNSPVAAYNSEEEGMVGQMFDPSSFSGPCLELTFDYNVGAGNTMYVHFRGADDQGALEWDVNLGAQNGHAWNSSNGGTGTTYNMFDGSVLAFGGSSGGSNSNAITLTGSGTFNQKIDISGYTVSDVGDYEYMMLGFAMNATADNPSTVSNLTLTTVPEPSSAAILIVGLGLLYSRRKR